MKIKSFEEFIFEEESSKEEETKKDEKLDDEPKVKDQRIGYTAAGKEVMSKMKVGHTLEFSSDDFRRLRNMKVTQYERDMYEHSRGGKDYKIKKDSEGVYTIFHYNKTLHELNAIGVFEIPLSKHKSEEKVEKSDKPEHKSVEHTNEPEKQHSHFHKEKEKKEESKNDFNI